MGRAKGAPPKAKKVPLYKKNNVPLLRAPNKSEGRMKRAMDPRLLCLKKRPAKPWRDCSDLEKARAQRVVGGWAEEHKQELAHKAPTGAEYAELVGMMFKFEIAASTARALFARKKRIRISETPENAISPKWSLTGASQTSKFTRSRR